MITANAGNDAGGIATFASVGADHGYRLLWILIPITISLGIVQEMCARMGAVTGKGLADLIRERFGVRWTALVMLALLDRQRRRYRFGVCRHRGGDGTVRRAAFHLGAARGNCDLVAGRERDLINASSASFSRCRWSFLATSFRLFSRVRVGNRRARNRATVIRDSRRFTFTLVAIIGTTISPYMQVFVQSSVVEKGVRPENYALTKVDVWVGTIFAILIVFFIVVSTAATLHVHGEHVDSAAHAARALRPLAGRLRETPLRRRIVRRVNAGGGSVAVGDGLFDQRSVRV